MTADQERNTHGFKGERLLMRIHLGEADKYEGKPLYAQIVEMLRKRQYAGCTVTRGIMGFGAHSKLHTDRFLELSSDLPIVVECIDTAERIQEILPVLDEMLGGGLITLERVKVIMYRAHLPPEQRTGSWSIDRLSSWGTGESPDQG
ncbi:MAG TPA: DUF190 domain-containing protein [Gemmatimonadaceae bacterium]|jgi:PII-like signaling protein|nr:DUF190 domain-containing protein [Gemmatimonadaceae bacterium]